MWRSFSVLVLGLCLVLTCVFTACQSNKAALTPEHIAPETMQTLFPDIRNQPLVLDFSSEWCIDCKRVKPVLKQLLTTYSSVQLREYEVPDDKADHPELFELFKPAVVPTLVFVKPDGTVVKTLNGMQNKEDLEAALALIARKQPAGQKPNLTLDEATQQASDLLKDYDNSF